jgi:hypothetical protein
MSDDFCSEEASFHGGNTGSNPVGDANIPFSLLIPSNTVNRDGLEVFKKPRSSEYSNPSENSKF